MPFKAASAFDDLLGMAGFGHSRAARDVVTQVTCHQIGRMTNGNGNAVSLRAWLAARSTDRGFYPHPCAEATWTLSASFE